MAGGLFDKTTDVLSKSLDLQLLRHSVISDNIANAETPGFKARRVEFESELQRAVDSIENNDGSTELKDLSPNIAQDPNSEMGQDLNTVDMDREMAQMTKNDMKYSATSQAVSKKFAMLRYAVTEGSDR